MKPLTLFFLTLLIPITLQAQVLEPLTAASKYLCIKNTVGKNRIGKFTSDGYITVSTAKARKALSKARTKLQEKLSALKDAKQDINNNLSGTVSLKSIKKFLKLLVNGELKGSKAQKLEILETGITLTENLVLLANAELKALSNCLNKIETSPPSGTYKAEIIVVKSAFQVLAVLIAGDRELSEGARYCIKKDNEPAAPPEPSSGYGFDADPCNSGTCKGMLGPNKIGLAVEGANFTSSATQEEYDAAVGRLTAAYASSTFQVRAKTAGRTCAEVFGE